MYYLTNYLLTLCIARMCLSGKDDLQRFLTVVEQFYQTLRISHQKVAALVCRKSSGKTNGKGLRVKNLFCSAKFGMKCASSFKLFLHRVSCKAN